MNYSGGRMKVHVISALSTLLVLVPGLYAQNGTGDTQTNDPLPVHHTQPKANFKVNLLATDGLAAIGDSFGTWAPATNPVPLNADTPLSLTDGSIAVQDYGTPNWWRLVPDQFGSYANGSWVSMGSMPQIAGAAFPYAPYDYCSAVLADGRLLVEGGEYTYDPSGTATASETNQGAIWDWRTNTWTAMTPPAGYTRIGDSSCGVLANGQFYQASFSVKGGLALMTPSQSLDWTVLVPPGKVDGNSEENFTLLPDGSVFTVDIRSSPGSERWIPPYLDGSATGRWISGGSIPASIGTIAYPQGVEMGSGVLRPDGTVFAVTGGPNTGANAGVNGIYHPPTTLTGVGTWTAAPKFPAIAAGQLDDCDGPSTMLPNGLTLVGVSPGCYNQDDHLYLFDGTNLTETVRPTAALTNSSFYARMLVVPDGTMLYTSDSNDLEVYTPTGGHNAAWEPVITSYAPQMNSGLSYVISGTQFNGLTQGAYYGDDQENYSNYPVVRFINHATGHVQYGRTHDHSSMGVQTGSQIVSTTVDVPDGLESGPADMEVVVNGIASQPVVVNGTVVLTTTAVLTQLQDGSYQAQVTITNSGTGDAQNVQLDNAQLGAANSTQGTLNLGTIAHSGGKATTTVNFPASAGTPGTGLVERYAGFYTGGTFGGSLRAVLP
jgi:hypothetical protein